MQRFIYAWLFVSLTIVTPAAADGGDDELMSWSDGHGDLDSDDLKHPAQFVRESNPFGVGLHYGSVLGDPAVGLEFFRNITGNLQVGGEFRTQKLNLANQVDPEPLSEVGNFHGRSDEALAIVRGYFGSTIYFGGGIGLRRANVDWETHEMLGNRHMEGKLTSYGLIADARVGSQWAFENGFYFALELANWTAAIAARDTINRRDGGLKSRELETTEDRVEAAARTYSRQLGTQYLGFELGVLF